MNKEHKILFQRYPDLVKRLVTNNIDYILDDVLMDVPDPNISITARSKELYRHQLFPDLKSNAEFMKYFNNKKILDVGCGYNPIYDESLISLLSSKKKKNNNISITGCDIIDMPMPNYKKCSVYTMNFRDIDTIIVNNFLYFWVSKPKDLMRAYRNLHKNLKKNGEIRVFPVYLNNYYQNDNELKKYIDGNFNVKMIKPKYHDEDPFYQDKEKDSIYVLTGLGEREAKINTVLDSHTLVLKKK